MKALAPSPWPLRLLSISAGRGLLIVVLMMFLNLISFMMCGLQQHPEFPSQHLKVDKQCTNALITSGLNYLNIFYMGITSKHPLQNAMTKLLKGFLSNTIFLCWRVNINQIPSQVQSFGSCYWRITYFHTYVYALCILEMSCWQNHNSLWCGGWFIDKSPHETNSLWRLDGSILQSISTLNWKFD